MPIPDARTLSRRKLLRFLASSPILAPAAAASLGGLERLLASSGADRLEPGALQQLAASHEPDVIAAAADALNVMDFEPVARQKLPPAHFGYIATGVDDDATIQANRDGFRHYQLRMRRLVDVSTIDMSVDLFGMRWDSPIVIAPAGSQRAFHPQGELATARAAQAKGHLQVLSTVSSTGVEAVCEARGEPVWYQLYASSDWSVTRGLVKRAEAAGCPALVLTVDLQGGSNRETLERAERRDTRQCDTCHVPGRRKPMYDGLDMTNVSGGNLAMSWAFVRRLKDLTPMKLLIKGIVTREDTELALENGVDGVWVSNHGGRAEESGRPTIACVEEVAGAAGGRIPVIVDSGFRRGTDIFKALALGATAVAVGRPYLWGLAGFGQEGVETVLEILRKELRTVMRQAGTTTIDRITRDYLVGPAFRSGV